LTVSVLMEADDNKHYDKSCSELENQLKRLLNQLDVSNVVRTRKILGFSGCLILIVSLMAVDNFRRLLCQV